MDKTCGSNFDVAGLSLYRKQRWHQSQVENPVGITRFPCLVLFVVPADPPPNVI